MFLAYPSPALSTEQGVIEGKAKELLEQKFWKEFRIKETRLVYCPYYFFSSNSIAVSAGNGKANKRVATELSQNIGKMVSEITSSLKASAEERKFSAEESQKISSSQEKPEIFFFPVWNAAVSVNGKEYLLKYSGVSGELVEKENIPQREKGTLEIVQETLEEMKDPKNWLTVGKEIISEAKKGFS